MAALTSKDRLQPALLDRLTDHAPLERAESREARVVSMRQLRRSVLRDISYLLNATALFERKGGAPYPHLLRSVLNYGIRDFTGTALSSIDALELANAIKKAIRDFEPRVASHSLCVSLLPPQDTQRHSSIAFLVEGDLWAQPYPERLYFRTELDLEDGGVSVADRTEVSPS